MSTTSTVLVEPIVQYIAIRSDLKWPTGALIAQGCHSSTAAIHLFYKDEETQMYLADLDRMHKICVSVLNENDLVQLSRTLVENNIEHKLWHEQPENIPTSLATKPYYKSKVKDFFKPFKLFK